MTEIVLTLQGLEMGGGDRMGGFLRGYATTAGRVRRVVDYGARLTVPLATGADVLDREIRAALETFDEATVIGHSRGAEAAGTWLARYARRAGAPPPDRLRFVLLGNPRRRYGGDGWGERTPDDTQYRVDDVTRRWDRWGNRDNWPSHPGAFGSGVRLWLGSMIDHANYDEVALEDCQVRAVVGNTRYLVAP